MSLNEFGYRTQALEQPAPATVQLRVDHAGAAAPDTNRVVVIHYTVANAPPNTFLTVALTETHLVTQVRRGENSGRTLRHEFVVRGFAVVSLEESSRGVVTLPLPTEIALANTTIIGFVQDRNTKQILGAGRL